MWFEQLLFFVAALLALGGALGVVALRNPFFSVLALVGHLIALALLFLLLRAEFLAAGQVVVYAGAVMVMYLFVVAYIGAVEEPLGPQGGTIRALAPLFAAALLIELTIAIVGSSLGLLDSRGADAGPGFGSPGEIGSLLLRTYLLPFEAASYLLLVAAVGAVVLARRRRGLEHPDGLERETGARPEWEDGDGRPQRLPAGPHAGPPGAEPVPASPAGGA